jgi:hypothetical protein
MELKWQFPWFDFRGINIAEMLIWDRSRSMENVRKVVENMGTNAEQDPIYKWFDSTLEDLQECSLSLGTHQTIPTRT